jgi:hypothetical protein
MNVALIDLFYKNEEWAKLRHPGAPSSCKRILRISRVVLQLY